MLTTIQPSSPMPFNAHREALIIEFAYHSLRKLDKSGKTQISPSKLDKSDKTQISPSRPWQANQIKSHEAPIIGFAYKQSKKKRWKLEEKDCLWPHGPSAIPDRFTGTVAHFCTFEARPTARAIPPPSWSSVPSVRDRPAQRTTTRPPLFLRTTHETALFI